MAYHSSRDRELTASSGTTSGTPTLGQSIAQLGAAVAFGPPPPRPPPPPPYTTSWEPHPSSPAMESTVDTFQTMGVGNWSDSVGSVGRHGSGMNPLGRPTSYTPVSSASSAAKREIFLSNERLQALQQAHPSTVVQTRQIIPNTTSQSQPGPFTAYSIGSASRVEPVDHQRPLSVDIGAGPHNTSLASSYQRTSGESWRGSLGWHTPTQAHVAEPGVPISPRRESSTRPSDAGIDARRISLGFPDVKVASPTYRKPVPSNSYLTHVPPYASFSTATPSTISDSSSSFSQPSTISNSPAACQTATVANSGQRYPWNLSYHTGLGPEALSDGAYNQGSFNHMLAQPTHTRNTPIGSEPQITRGNNRYSQPEPEPLKHYPSAEVVGKPTVARLAANSPQTAQGGLGRKEDIRSEEGVERPVSVVGPAYLHHMQSPWDLPSSPAPYPPRSERQRSTGEGRIGSIAELPTINHLQFEVWEKE